MSALSIPNASRLAPPMTRRHYPEEATVAPTQEARVEVLEVKVQTLEEKVENLETNAGPGRAEAQSGNLAELRRQFAEFGEVQAKQSQSIDIVTGKFNGLKEASTDHAFKLVVLDSGVRQLKDEVSGKFARLDHDVAGLKGDFAWLRGQFHDGGLLVGLSQDMTKLRDDVTVIEVKVDTLQADVSGLKTDVAELKTDVSELKTDMAEVKGSLKEILDRLPAKAA
jgi:outer membrane murein-binding lipoprotein Lpp